MISRTAKALGSAQGRHGHALRSGDRGACRGPHRFGSFVGAVGPHETITQELWLQTRYTIGEVVAPPGPKQPRSKFHCGDPQYANELLSPTSNAAVLKWPLAILGLLSTSVIFLPSLLAPVPSRAGQVRPRRVRLALRRSVKPTSNQILPGGGNRHV
jgi:hypothetical protein